MKKTHDTSVVLHINSLCNQNLSKAVIVDK